MPSKPASTTPGRSRIPGLRNRSIGATLASRAEATKKRSKASSAGGYERKALPCAEKAEAHAKMVRAAAEATRSREIAGR